MKDDKFAWRNAALEFSVTRCVPVDRSVPPLAGMLCVASSCNLSVSEVVQDSISFKVTMKEMEDGKQK